jgi:hypothetical protein
MRGLVIIGRFLSELAYAGPPLFLAKQAEEGAALHFKSIVADEPHGRRCMDVSLGVEGLALESAISCWTKTP